MWTRRVYPPKALVLLLLNPSLSLQGCAVFIGAKQGPRTGSGAALSTSGSYRSLFGKQLCKLPQLCPNLPANSLRRQRTRAWILASDFRKQTGLSCLMQPPCCSGPQGAVPQGPEACRAVSGFPAAPRALQSCTKFWGTERCLHCFSRTSFNFFHIPNKYFVLHLRKIGTILKSRRGGHDLQQAPLTSECITFQHFYFLKSVEFEFALGLVPETCKGAFA